MEAIESNINVWYITGCTSGFGLSLVEELLKNPLNRVTGTSRDIKKIEQLSDTITKNSNFLGIQVDILSEDNIKESIEKTIKLFGNLTHIVNNAGSSNIGSLEESSENDFKTYFEVLYFYPVRVIRAALPWMRQQKQGYIFNVSSALAYNSLPRYGIYSGAKSALASTTQSLALDVKPFNIKVSTIVLGYFKTNFTNQHVENQIEEYDTKNFWNTYMGPLFATMVPGDVKKLSTILVDHYAKQNDLPNNLYFGTNDTFSFLDARFKELGAQLLSQKDLNSQV
ncbi:hypothetical protein DICPUDRAFT_73900 [Dictyostelium purpureum]|uniref:Uncharacterized protein n=1 Tax=Dictyostelium purpureum TaxID=5786 RepID=F0Z673_DICPU|nr:uncharacterized protein DICPUDRAFT_73900 [Dictyostelium purpureum]EGC40547.1 hypothetical protein DICPUDRAFT_73900 [Dictyostelium purpureum]|eukprot:XP_003282883.1 hypothetical protein DICPUDRAFT_73900 [Dictyostelium purpureum]